MLEDLFGIWSDKLVGFLWHGRRRDSASVSEPDGLEWLHERRGVSLKSKKGTTIRFLLRDSLDEERRGANKDLGVRFVHHNLEKGDTSENYGKVMVGRDISQRKA